MKPSPTGTRNLLTCLVRRTDDLAGICTQISSAHHMSVGTPVAHLANPCRAPLALSTSAGCMSHFARNPRYLIVSATIICTAAIGYRLTAQSSPTLSATFTRQVLAPALPEAPFDLR